MEHLFRGALHNKWKCKKRAVPLHCQFKLLLLLLIAVLYYAAYNCNTTFLKLLVYIWHYYKIFINVLLP